MNDVFTLLRENADAPTRMYMSEIGFHVAGGPVLTLQQQDFPILDTRSVISHLEEYPSHIYMVCQSARFTFDPLSLQVVEGVLHGLISVQHGPSFHHFAFGGKLPFVGEISTVECAFPYSEASVFTASGQRAGRVRAWIAASLVGVPELRNELNFEVMYVGQAFGANGERTSPDRLKSHSTVQEIYAKALADHRDRDVHLLLCHFEAQYIMSMDGRAKKYLIDDAADTAHVMQALEEPPTLDQEVCITEAALINYFQPKYNLTFKGVFPSAAHSSYSSCYSLDFNSLILEVDTDELGFRLCSGVTAPNWHHLNVVHFHSAEERRSMFALVIPD